MARVQRSAELPASCDEVWAALVDPSRLSSWFGGPGRIEAEVGGRVEIALPDGPRQGSVVDIEPARRLAFVWWPVGAGGVPRVADSTRVTVTLEPADGGCRFAVAEGPVHGR